MFVPSGKLPNTEIPKFDNTTAPEVVLVAENVCVETIQLSAQTGLSIETGVVQEPADGLMTCVEPQA